MGKQQIVSYDEMLSVDRISLFSVCSLINGEELVIRWDGDTPFQDATVVSEVLRVAEKETSLFCFSPKIIRP